MVEFSKFLIRPSPIRVLLVGDLMLDSYTRGRVDRVSPEAPVTVLKVEELEFRPGGAGNVAINFLSLGAEVSLLGRVGDDFEGEKLVSLLTEKGINGSQILFQKGYPTPIKNRLLAQGQQLLRIDREKIEPLPSSYVEEVLLLIPQLLEGIDILCLSDYNKGFLTEALLQGVIQSAKEKGVLILVDPKGAQFAKYRGATIIKPNEKEAYVAAGLSDTAPLEQVAERIFLQTDANFLVVTRSASGISLFKKEGGRQDFPTRVKEVRDVTGAGDTVLAMLGASLANGYTLLEAIELANLAAGLAVEKLGCVAVTLSEVAGRLLEIDAGNKVFSGKQKMALQKVLQNSAFALVVIRGYKEVNHALVETLERIKKKSEVPILTLLKDPSPTFLKILSSLREVDLILMGTEEEFFSTSIVPVERYCIENDSLIDPILA